MVTLIDKIKLMKSFKLEDFNDPLCVISSSIMLFNIGIDYSHGREIIIAINESKDFILRRFIALDLADIQSKFRGDKDFEQFFLIIVLISDFDEILNKYIFVVECNGYKLSKKSPEAARLSENIGKLKSAITFFVKNIKKLDLNVGPDFPASRFFR